MTDILFTPNIKSCISEDERLEAIKSYLNSESELSLSLPPRYIEQFGVEYMDYSNLAIGCMSSFALETYPEVAALEVAMAIENGADFIEVNLDYHSYANDRDSSLSQIKLIAEEVADDAALWVLLDSEEFYNFDLYRDAILSLQSCGIDGIVLNSTRKPLNEIKFFDETLQLSQQSENELLIKIFCDQIYPEISKFDSVVTRINI